MGIRKLFSNQPAIKPNRSVEESTALRRAAESLKRRIKGTREYEVISEPEAKLKDIKGAVTESWIWDSEYDNALRLEKKLILQFKGKCLEEAIPGKIVSNEHGDCYSIADECVSKFKKVDYDESRRLIISNLKIIPGIGPIREQTLKEQGYMTIEDLKNHPIWQKPAREFLKMIDAKEVGPTQNWLWQRLPKSHPLVHYLAGFCKDEDLAVIDIETLGLSERPIVLLGIAKPGEKRICTSQFLLRDISDEIGAIWEFISHLETSSSLITFNGRSFDIPYIRQRLA